MAWNCETMPRMAASCRTTPRMASSSRTALGSGGADSGSSGGAPGRGVLWRQSVAWQKTKRRMSVRQKGSERKARHAAGV